MACITTVKETKAYPFQEDMALTMDKVSWISFPNSKLHHKRSS